MADALLASNGIISSRLSGKVSKLICIGTQWLKLELPIFTEIGCNLKLIIIVIFFIGVLIC